MREITKSHEIDHNVLLLIKCKTFEETMKHEIKILTPICHLLDICERRESSIADAVDQWMNLEIPEKYEKIFFKRRKMALNKYAVSAYMIHPKYKGKQLSNDDRKTANSFILKQLTDPAALNGFEDFLNGKIFFKL